tara:strand:+ start:129 stop:515 length:387 start_codon:yes stop_codon:yes gene_type:complete
MNNIQKRFLLFLFGCIGTRVAFAYVAKVININYLPIMGYFALIPTIGFMYIFLSGSREKGAEVFGNKIWWNSLRPVHAILYGLFSLYAIKKKRESWRFLAIDVTIGLIAFLYYHAYNNNFKKLLVGVN